MQKDNHLARLTRPSKPAKDSELAWESGGCGVYESVSKSHRGRLWTRPDPGAKNKRDCDAKFPPYWLCVQYGSRIEAGGDWVHKGATHPPVLYVCKMYMHACTHTHTHTHTLQLWLWTKHKRTCRDIKDIHPSFFQNRLSCPRSSYLMERTKTHTSLHTRAHTYTHTHTRCWKPNSADVARRSVQLRRRWAEQWMDLVHNIHLCLRVWGRFKPR